MKRIIIVFLALFLVVPLMAQEDKEIKSGYKAIIELKLFPELGHHQIGALMTNIIGGYQINNHFSVGIGTGFAYINNDSGTDQDYDDVGFVPLFAMIEWNILDSRISPNLSLSTGYLFAPYIKSFDKSYPELITGGGFFVNPNGGVTISIIEQLAAKFGVSFIFSSVPRSDHVYGPCYGPCETPDQTTIYAPFINVGLEIDLAR